MALPRLWQNLWVRLAVALAFADASIVVLALPQIVDRLHTSISPVTWVIMAYNLALIVACAAILAVAQPLPATPTLIAGLALFGLASLGCGAANSLAALVPLRCAQGVGGALVLCASLPLFAGAARPGDSPLYGWSAAAAIGAAVGPAAGGVLTQLFDWRSIFFAQAPVAAVAAIAVLTVSRRSTTDLEGDVDWPPSALDPLTANLALLVLSAGLIGALFLVVIELINAWQLTPIVAAVVVTTIPVGTAVTERLVRRRSPFVLGAAGAVLLAAGLAVLALISQRQPGLVVLALALCGSGLGLAFPGLTRAALETSGSPVGRAAKTVAARDAGLILGLLVLTPVFVNQLNAAPDQATRDVAKALFSAPIPVVMKFELVPGLTHAYKIAPQSRPPDLGPAFEQVSANASAAQRVELALLEQRLNLIVNRAATHAFKRPFAYAAAFALLVLPLLAVRLTYVRRRHPRAARLSAA
jgi:predicted MFS family arabinose efflux permease